MNFWEELFFAGLLFGGLLIFPLGIKIRPSFWEWETAQAFTKFRREMILALIGVIILVITCVIGALLY